MSVWHTPAARMRTTTSPGPGARRCTSSCTSNGSPGFQVIAARNATPLLRRSAQLGVAEYGLHLEVLLETECAELAAEPGRLVAAERRDRHARQAVPGDPGLTCPKSGRETTVLKSHFSTLCRPLLR